HHKIEGEAKEVKTNSNKSMRSVRFQIIVLDIVFSFDSILTAVGLVHEVIIMIIGVVIALVIMITFADKISNFINEHPTLQILALSFVILIGFMLLIEGFHFEVPTGYIYFAVFCSLGVEVINMKVRKNQRSEKITLSPRLKKEEKRG